MSVAASGRSDRQVRPKLESVSAEERALLRIREEAFIKRMLAILESRCVVLAPYQPMRKFSFKQTHNQVRIACAGEKAALTSLLGESRADWMGCFVACSQLIECQDTAIGLVALSDTRRIPTTRASSAS